MSPSFAEGNSLPIVLVVYCQQLGRKSCGREHVRNLLVLEEAGNASTFQPALEQAQLGAIR